jgi:hypothetical protein
MRTAEGTRDDYREFAQLILVATTGRVTSGFRLSGAFDQARRMAKGIYMPSRSSCSADSSSSRGGRTRRCASWWVLGTRREGRCGKRSRPAPQPRRLPSGAREYCRDCHQDFPPGVLGHRSHWLRALQGGGEGEVCARAEAMVGPRRH